MPQSIRDSLTERLYAAMARRGMSARAVGVAACRDTRPVYRILRGGNVSLPTMERLDAWLQSVEEEADHAD